ncbi:MAG: 3-hydroxyacyl-CoA dehydrogenase NAD-binding domain-containing protein, partial [Xanthobacteraceae bacterium]
GPSGFLTFSAVRPLVRRATPEQARAMEYVAAAEREAAIIPDIPASTATRKIGKAAIIGAGTMGGGIAMSFANIGIPVALLNVSQEALDRGIDRVRHNYATTVSRGRLDQATMDKRMGLSARGC